MSDNIKPGVLNIVVPFYDIGYWEVGDWHTYIAVTQTTTDDIKVGNVLAHSLEEAEQAVYRAEPERKLIHLAPFAGIIGRFVVDGIQSEAEENA